MVGDPRGSDTAGGDGTVPPMSDLSPDYFLKPVAEVDPEIAEVLKDEAARQERTLEMIASENFVPQAVLDCQGSVLTNKYAEGYPGRRYYGGCEYVDIAEQLAIDRAKALFGADHVNVQPHSGAQANSAVYMALLDPGDRILGMKLDHGGHLSHGMKINFSGRYFDVVAYGVREEDQRLDMDELAQIAEDAKPKLIIAGWSAYSRQLDFQRFREIADSVGAILMADIAHFAGLVAAEEHPSPIPYCDVVTTTTHKTLGGGRGGMIMCREEYAKKIDSAVFPGHQGGPLMHTIAGKAVTFKIAQSDLFRERQRRTREGAAIAAEEMVSAGVNVLTGGTDVHLVLADLRESELDGKQAEDRLHEIGITVNRNAVPFDPRPPAVSSGLRIGTPALATRGFQADDFREVGRVIGEALTGEFSDSHRAELTERTRALADRHPLYPQLAEPAVA
jgi:glycine hydroxymethyltransferase